MTLARFHDTADASRAGQGRVVRLFRPHRRLLAAFCALVLVTVVLSAASPLLLQTILNDALPQRRTELLGVLCVAMLVCAALTTALSIWQGMLVNHIGQQVVHDLRLQVYDRVRSMDLEFFTADANTEIQSRLVSDIGGINEILTLTVHGVVTSTIGLVTAAGVMLLLNWPLALASIALTVLLNKVNQRFSDRRRALATQAQEHVAGILKLVAEDLTLPGVILGRTLGATGRQRARFANLSRELSAVTYRQRLAGRTAMSLMAMTFAALPPTIYWLSGTLVPSITLGTAVVLATMQARLAGPIQYLFGLNGTWQSARAMFERVFEYVDLPGDDDVPDEAAVALRPTGHVPSLAARGVSFAYRGSESDAVSSAVVEFAPRSLTVVTGHSGCGKSTLSLLLSGLLTPGSGTIDLDGIPADVARLRESVTVVSQDGMLFNSSLRENLLFACPTATDADLLRVIEEASLDQLVRRLPSGLDSAVGERGFQLSGGERQRVALARALLSGHRILILDEATSALDGLTADAIHQRLCVLSRHKTVILIAHRLPQLLAEHNVVVMDDSRIVDSGLHSEVTERCDLYRRLLAAQAAVAVA